MYVHIHVYSPIPLCGRKSFATQMKRQYNDMDVPRLVELKFLVDAEAMPKRRLAKKVLIQQLLRHSHDGMCSLSLPPVYMYSCA